MFYVLVIAFIVGFLAFSLAGKRNGYQVLAQRTKALNQSGVPSVYLASSLSPAKQRLVKGAQANAWTFINTGYLLYVKDNQIVVEYPWWKQIGQLGAYDINTELPLETTESAGTVWHKQPGISLGKLRPELTYSKKRKYTLCGINQTEASQVKAYLKHPALATVQEIRSRFLAEVGFTAP